jgi:hypothetical protein
VATAVPGFTANYQNDRGALALVNGTLYIPYAGLNDDCNPGGGSYHGWVVGINTTNPTAVKGWSTTAGMGGIWGAVTSDGTSIFAVTGNTRTGTNTWGGGEALIRFSAGPVFSGTNMDYFTPTNWQSMDSSDNDLGSSPSVLIDVPGATPSTLATAGGKDGTIRLLNRANLGGVGSQIFSKSVAAAQLKGTPAAYTTAKGQYVVLRSSCGNMNGSCPNGTSGDMMALSVTATNPPSLVPAWCASSQPGSENNCQDSGDPIATTTDGRSNGIVWIASLGNHRLLAFNADTGTAIFPKGTEPQMGGSTLHWTSPVVAKGRLLIGGVNKVFAFTAL